MMSSKKLLQIILKSLSFLGSLFFDITGPVSNVSFGSSLLQPLQNPQCCFEVTVIIATFSNLKFATVHVCSNQCKNLKN